MERQKKLDAQRQYMVNGTLALHFFFVNFDVSRAAAPKGTEGVCFLSGGY